MTPEQFERQRADRLAALTNTVQKALALEAKPMPRQHLETKPKVSGHRCVSWHKRVGKWQAQIRRGKRIVALGYYVDPAEAAQAVNRERRRIERVRLYSRQRKQAAKSRVAA